MSSAASCREIRHSLGVYVLQVPILYLLGNWTADGWPAGPRFGLLMVGSLAGAYAIVILLTRNRVGALSVGEQNAREPRARHASPLQAKPRWEA